MAPRTASRVLGLKKQRTRGKACRPAVLFERKFTVDVSERIPDVKKGDRLTIEIKSSSDEEKMTGTLYQAL